MTFKCTCTCTLSFPGHGYLKTSDFYPMLRMYRCNVSNVLVEFHIPCLIPILPCQHGHIPILPFQPFQKMQFQNRTRQKITLMRESTVSPLRAFYSENMTDRQTHTRTHTHTEHQQDKRISRDDEYSDSEDEGDGRRNEHTYRDIKRPRLLEEQRSKPSILPKSVTGGQAISSPVPPEPSPITPVAQDEGGPPTNKGTCSTITLVECGIHIYGGKMTTEWRRFISTSSIKNGRSLQ